MNSAVNTKFAVKPVAAALALALSAATAYAAPTPNQMPGRGIVTAVSFGGGNSIGVPGTFIPSLASGTNITVNGKNVLTWGCSAVSAACSAVPPIDPTNPSGFNLGAAAVLGFTSAMANSAVLNIDVSGNNSQIYGLLLSNTNAGFAPAVFVSNSNGITVAAGARIVAPTGVGLIGGNMNTVNQIYEFIGNNNPGTPVPPLPTMYGNSYIDVTPGSTGPINIGGSINGDFLLNTPAQYIFIAGGSVNVLNTGNLFGYKVVIDPGMIATATTQTVGGVTNQAVNRLWNVDTGAEDACCYVGPSSGDLTIGAAGSNFVNLGSISAKQGGPSNAYITVQASGNITSGTAGDTNTQVGMFADAGIYLDSYSNTSSVQVYNVVSGYTTNRVLPFLYVNRYAYNPYGVGGKASFSPDVTINAILPGSGQPSTVSTTYDVKIFGGNVTIQSTINDKDAAHGGTQAGGPGYDLTIVGSKSVNIAANIGAGNTVTVVDNGGPLTISGNILSDTDMLGLGGINVYNNAPGATTTISGNLTVPASAGPGNQLNVGTYGPTTVSGALTNVNNDVNLTNAGTGASNFTLVSGNVTAGRNVNIYNTTSLNAKPLTVTGNVTAGYDVSITNNGSTPGESTLVSGNVTSLNHNVYIYNNGLANSQLTVTGTVNASNNAYISSNGNARVASVYAGNYIYEFAGGIANTITGPWGAGTTQITAPLAFTKLLPAAVISSPNIGLNVLNFQGVNAAGNPYLNAGQKPTAQLVTNNLNVVITGTINAGIVGNTNWPLNSMDIMPFFGLSPVFVNFTANGGGFQAVNLQVLGNGIFSSGGTTTPFIGVPLTTGGLPAGGIQGNLGSQLILQTTGSMTINGTPTFTLFGPPTAFQWPGGAAFIAGTTLQTNAPIYNAWSTDSPPFGGVFFTAPYIALGSFIATSGTAWANISTAPVTGFPTVYQIHNLTPTTFGFAANAFAVVKNDYTKTVVGGAVCTITGPTTFTACP